ncbi:hypothetical protein TrST_g207 [Triparma strigata]|uniref:Uncharacterized protein n=1 Tax=Triparma strigata TaxID=1606541 RepID=A0A9W7A7X6_9STRA|nr:hypothetical protein TrST_g207 [Triparma strigata]
MSSAGAPAGLPDVDPNVCIVNCSAEIDGMKKCIDSLPADGDGEGGGEVALSKCIVHVAAWKDCCERAKYEAIAAAEKK